eukprot:Polyplicarium_translucidae@DN879_c0_g1_i1.p1
MRVHHEYCSPGNVVTSPGFALPAAQIFHAVGPRVRGSAPSDAEATQLRSCYRQALQKMASCDANAIAFPCISTGVYRYPAQAAAKIAVEEVVEFLKGDEAIQLVVFCTFLESDFLIYKAQLRVEAAEGDAGGGV